MTVVTQTDAKCALKLFHQRWDRPRILATFNGRYTWDEIDIAFAELRAWRRNFYLRNYANNGGRRSVRASKTHFEPEVTEAQKHRRMLRPATLTALLCGDPLPTESMLDRRLTAPSIVSAIHSDPLDALVYGRISVR